MPDNLILCTDSYKASHWLQYPEGMDGMYSYVEARSGGVGQDFTVFFGLQAIMDRYLSQAICMEDVQEAAAFFAAHGVPFNQAGWERIVEHHQGRLPVRILAVPEGTVVPNKNVLMSIEATDPELPWVGSYLETLLLRVWYPITVATYSYQAKILIREALLRTADDLSGLPFKLHDFGARGVSSGESAQLGGMSHLVNFMGSDTVEGIVAAIKHYHLPAMPAFSVPAAEHSTITSWGRENEVEAYRNILNTYAKPGHIVAVVSDSYDIYHACDQLWGQELRQQIIDSGATLVIRPDSGEPSEVIPKMLAILEQRFGITINSKGFKVLQYVRLIQGDGLNGPADIAAIIDIVESQGYSIDNIAFGMGGGLLQKINRDTLGFAMKCSAVRVDGVWRDVFKDPITSAGKKSKKGRLDLVQQDGVFQTLRHEEAEALGLESALQLVYENGQIIKRFTLEEVRQNTALW